MEEQSGGEAEVSPVDRLHDFVTRQLEALDDPRNVHGVRERLYGERWLDGIDEEELPESLATPLRADLDLAWSALTRYPWDLYGAQVALKRALERFEA